MRDYGLWLAGMSMPGGEDPLGIWAVHETTPVTAFSSMAAGSSSEVAAWQVALPGSKVEAQFMLDNSALAVQRTFAALAKIQEELEDFNTAFAFSGGETFPVQKDYLREVISSLELSAESALAPGSAFALAAEMETGEVPEEYREELSQWQVFVHKVQEMVTTYARVETARAGLPVGLTRIGWNGDFKTTWMAGVPLDSMALHSQSVNLALSSRLALLRIVGVVTSGAAALALKAAALPPGGQVLLLPAVWRFVKDILKILREA